MVGVCIRCWAFLASVVFVGLSLQSWWIFPHQASPLGYRAATQISRTRDHLAFKEQVDASEVGTGNGQTSRRFEI
jgi:hypothetical protein